MTSFEIRHLSEEEADAIVERIGDEEMDGYYEGVEVTRDRKELETILEVDHLTVDDARRLQHWIENEQEDNKMEYACITHTGGECPW